MTTLADTYHDQLNGEVGALSTDVGNVAARLKEALPVAASLWAGHLWKTESFQSECIVQDSCVESFRTEQSKYMQLTQTDFLGS